MHEHPFYDKDILRNREQEYVKKLLIPFKDRPVDDELKKEVWELLCKEKLEGRLSIPFKLALRRDSTGKYPPFLEIILDTKV